MGSCGCQWLLQLCRAFGTFVFSDDLYKSMRVFGFSYYSNYVHDVENWRYVVWQVSAGEVDAKRLCIDGRSAGGYTTMAALVFSNTFTAGASLYGVSLSICILASVSTWVYPSQQVEVKNSRTMRFSSVYVEWLSVSCKPLGNSVEVMNRVLSCLPGTNLLQVVFFYIWSDLVLSW